MNETQEAEHSLVFENHQHTLCENIINYFKKEVLVNVTLLCKGEPVKAHQLILSACSSFFENILTDLKRPDPIIVFADIGKNEMEIILKYMYEGRVSIPNNLVSAVLRAAKTLELKGLNNGEFNNLQSTFVEDPTNATNVTPNLSAILKEPNELNVGPEPEYNIPVPVVPELNSEKQGEKWLTANHNSDKQKVDGKKVLNPFAKKLNSSSGSDSTVFDSERAVPGPSADKPKKMVAVATSPMSDDSDIEIIDVNPVVVIPDTQYTEDSTIRAIEKKYNSRRYRPDFSDTDDGEILPLNIKKLKTEQVENDDVVQKVKVNPVALKSRSKENLNHPTTSKDVPSSSNRSHEDCNQKRTDKRSNLDQKKSNKTKDSSAASNSKKNNNPLSIDENAPEPFEGFRQKALINLRNFCVICKKERKCMREHIKRKHSIPPRGKIFCEICSKRFSFRPALALHICK